MICYPEVVNGIQLGSWLVQFDNGTLFTLRQMGQVVHGRDCSVLRVNACNVLHVGATQEGSHVDIRPIVREEKR